MPPYTVVLLFILFCLYSNVESNLFIWTGKNNNTRWSDTKNWNCQGTTNKCDYLPTANDDVHISNITDDGVLTEVGVFSVAQCNSLSLSGPVNLTIHDDLIVGKGGIESNKSSVITLMKNLSSQGNVNVKGTFYWNSGEAHGPGNYTFDTLQASVCHIYAHVNANTVILSSQITTADIQIYQNAWLTIEQQLTVNNNSVISGNISANYLHINYNLTLTGSVIQKFAHVTLDDDIKKVLIPKLEAPIIISIDYLPNLQQVFVFSPDANITATGKGSLSIFPGAKVHLSSQSLNSLVINTAGNLTVHASRANIINVIGGFFRSGYIYINNLNVSGATLVGDMDVNSLTLGDESNLFGSVKVWINANMYGTQNYAGNLTIASGSSAIFENSNIFPLKNVNGFIINSGTCTINGNFSCSASMTGKGNWNVDGTWFVQGPCNVSGNINLKGNSVLKIDSAHNSYTFGDITGGSIIGSGDGIFTAKDIDVDLFFDHFSNVKIDTLSSTNYTSVCCASKEIRNINLVDILILDRGIYNFSGHHLMKEVSYLRLCAGVTLKLHAEDVSFIIDTFDFFGGYFSSLGSFFHFKQINMIGNDKKMLLDNTVLSTDILDWTKCSSDDCGMSQWSNIDPSDCVCDCTHCKNGTCAPRSNGGGDYCLCKSNCSCGNQQSCKCGTELVSKINLN